jgi:hypothetical protein
MNRTKAESIVRTHDPEVVAIPFRASLDAANAPTLLEGKSPVTSVTRLGAGLFRVRLDDQYAAIVSHHIKFAAAAAVDRQAQAVAGSVTPNDAGGAYLDVRLQTAAAVATDPPATGANYSELVGVIFARQRSLT